MRKSCCEVLSFKAGSTCQRPPTVPRQRWLDQTSNTETDSRHFYKALSYRFILAPCLTHTCTVPHYHSSCTSTCNSVQGETALHFKSETLHVASYHECLMQQNAIQTQIALWTAWSSQLHYWGVGTPTTALA